MDVPFEDDSSTALGLTHHLSGSRIDAHFAPLEAAVRKDIDELARATDKEGHRLYQDLSQVTLRNDGAHAELQHLLDEGCDLWDALEYLGADAISEPANPDDERPDPEGAWPSKKTESLMRASITPDKRGARSRTKRHGTVDRPDATAIETELRRAS